MDTQNETAWKPDSHCLALDGIRGLAILAVTIYRLGKELDPNSLTVFAWIRRLTPIGERGVDLFFVLSGFLITGILIRSKAKPNYFRNFIIRRSLRIFPLYFLSLLIGLWVLPMLVPSNLLDQARDKQLYLWTYTSNLKMAWDNQWSFGAFDHFWSLCVEEHFYFIWPLVVMLLSSRRLAFLCIVLFVITGCARTIAATQMGWEVAVSVATYFRIDALAIGSCSAVLLSLQIDKQKLRRASLWTCAVTLPLLIGVAFMARRILEIPNTLCAIFFAAGITYVILSDPRNALVRFFESIGLRALGKYSYGMYVLQLPLVSLLPLKLVAPYLPFSVFWDGISYIALMFVVIYLAALVSYHLFEKHFLKWKSSFS